MLELIDLDQSISKEDYEKQFPDLEQELGECQRLARAAGVPVIVVFEGWDASGKGTIINRLTRAMDPRGFKVHPILSPTEAEAFYPWMWRFWNKLPAAGDWAIFDRSWYRRVLEDFIDGVVDRQQASQALEDIHQFEQQLVDGGAVIVKFWLHISKHEQKKRFHQLADNPATAWKVGKAEHRQHQHYEKWLAVVEEMLARTSGVVAPWSVIEATQRRFARVAVFRALIAAVREALKSRSEVSQQVASQVSAEAAPQAQGSPPPVSTILDRVDLSVSLDREAYDSQRKELNARLLQAEYELYVHRIPAVICYEGWDAGGKGGNIKRVTLGLDPRGYEVVPIAAPTKEEKAHHYLWRFWRSIPKAGHISIFDRTWYGRVLVERVEGFCSEADWKRAYEEINQFERQLVDYGAVIVKFWLQIDADEQLRRFQERQNTPAKQWKITDEDWRNRDKRPRYEPAVIEMLRRTSTPHAPWTILEANCKYYARIKALRTVAESLEKAVTNRKP
jgi:AMP-polyphosphate phosphotransferase